MLLYDISLFLLSGKQHWLAPSIIILFLALTPLWVYVSVKNKYSNDAICHGWVPVLSAMVISRLVYILFQVKVKIGSVFSRF